MSAAHASSTPTTSRRLSKIYRTAVPRSVSCIQRPTAAKAPATMRAQMTTTATTTAAAATTAATTIQLEEAGRVGVALLMIDYSAACAFRRSFKAEHSAMTREARAIGLVR